MASDPGQVRDGAFRGERLRDVMALLFTGGTINIMKIIVIQELLGKDFAGLREGGGDG